MPKWIVPFSGKIIVEADGEKEAQETTNVYLRAKGLSGAKAGTYGIEKLDEAEIIQKPIPAVTVEDLLGS